MVIHPATAGSVSVFEGIMLGVSLLGTVALVVLGVYLYDRKKKKKR
ncbi:hypothetical protein [Bacillus thuringiensis]|nr:hypothetical protein [Bacillus thuringiensis]